MPLLIRSRPALPLPPVRFNPNCRIVFRHPGYSDDYEQNVLFRLYAFDEERGGLHYRTAITACGIVAGNAWDGYLTPTRNGDKLQLADDDLLPDGSYYFHLPPSGTTSSSSTSSNENRYAIYLSFEHWMFPHNHLPPSFPAPVPGTSTSAAAPPSASNITPAVLSRDGSCCLTSYADALESAHLCPRSQTSWFEGNGMSRYNKNQVLPGEYLTEDLNNVIALRSDIHTIFDEQNFAIVPKLGKWVAHFFGLTNTLGGLHHNQIVNLDSDIAPAFLLARLAWTVFPMVREFLEAGPDRRVRVRVKDGGQFREDTQDLTSMQIRGMNLATDSGRENPRKRKAASRAQGPLQSDTYTTPEQRDSEERISNIRATKRPRLLAITSTSRPWDLQSGSANSDTSLPSHNAYDFPSHNENNAQLAQQSRDFNDYIKDLRREWLRSRRPDDPTLYCCDYNQVERDVQDRVPGDKRKGGAHLCRECLGAEYQDFEVEEET